MMGGWVGGRDALDSGYQRWLDGLVLGDVNVRLHPLAFQPPGPYNGTWTISHWDPAHRCWHNEQTTTLGEFETEALETLCASTVACASSSGAAGPARRSLASPICSQETTMTTDSEQRIIEANRLKARLSVLRDDEARAAIDLERFRKERRALEQLLYDTIMLSAFGIKRGDIIVFTQEQRGFRREHRQVRRRLKIMSFSGTSDKPDEIWIVGKTIYANGQEGVRYDTVYGLQSVTFEGKVD